MTMCDRIEVQRLQPESTATQKIESQDSLQAIHRRMFIVQGLIGVGGFGEVLAASLQQTGKWYALKVVNKADLMKHKSGLAMIFGELEAMSRVEQHPFIVSLHLAYHDRRNCYLAMDLKTGGDLRYYLRKKMTFEERDVAFYVACISSALHHIHSKNMLHRDIKPENIILDERGWPHLADFGVAYVHDSTATDSKYGNTLTCTLASGTKQYLGPEVFGKEHIHGPEADFWSLAVVAYELIYTKRPFEKHCAIEFITYLERALSKQRKLKREARVKEVQMSEIHGDMCDTGGAESPCRHSVDVPLSPDRNAHARMSPCVSTSTSRESSCGNFPSISLGFGTRSGSFDHLPQDKSVGYCSSAQYTPVQTASNSQAIRRSGSGYTSGASSQANSRSSTPLDADMMEAPSGKACAGSKLHSSCDRLEGLLLGSAAGIGEKMARPCTVAPENSRGISFEGGDSSPTKHVQHLPKLGAQQADSGCNSPPKILRVPKQGSFLPPAASGASSPVKVILQQQQAGVQPQLACNHKNPLAASPAPEPARGSFVPTVVFGDHWAVDEDATLPSSLRVHIPQSNIWLGKVSNEGVAYLKAAFDIRPSHRLSSRNIDAIRTHPWMQAYGLSDWQDLHSRNYSPNFRPGKRFMKETFSDPSNTMLPGAGNALHDPDGHSSADNYFEARRQQQMDVDGVSSADSAAAALTEEQRASFRGFRYTAPALQGLFVNREPEIPTCTGTATSGESFTSVGSGALTLSGKMVC